MPRPFKDRDWLSVGIAAACFIVSAVWFCLQLVVWREEGHDHMLTVANIVITLLLWMILGYSIFRLVGINRNHLQRDALRLSKQLLKFLKRLGPPPTPKYTEEQLRSLPLTKTTELVNAEDGDYAEACEYHFGNGHFTPRTADGLHNFIMARTMRLWPWYDKVKASYALEFKDDIERMHHRFTIEGLADDGLLLPVEGRDGVKNIRTIASKLWELAYKVEEKEVPVEKS